MGKILCEGSETERVAMGCKEDIKTCAVCCSLHTCGLSDKKRKTGFGKKCRYFIDDGCSYRGEVLLPGYA